MRVECGREIPVGLVVLIQGHDMPGRHATVRHCTAFGDKFRVGLEMCQDESFARYSQPRQDDVDFYEALQINAKADPDTIHRVYRLMAMRYHPDNPETGDVETFLLLKRAYETLSDPERRALYDAARDSKESGPLPVFELRDFVEGVQGEINRRLGVLALLYNRRRTDPDHPGISLLDLENRMGFPREYLSFTMWYLRSKFFVDLADNSDFSLTAAGAEYVETNTSSSEPLSKLITGGFWKPTRERSEPMHYERPKPQLLSAPATM
jgi:curved DNA-binding protein CbpA